MQKYAKHYMNIETGIVSEDEVLKYCEESDSLLPDIMPEDFKNPAKLIEVIERSSPDDFGHLVELSYKVWKHYDTLLE